MEERLHCIYMITSPNGKSYVGQTMNFEKRMREHNKTTSGCLAIRDAILKYGFENMKVEILLKNLTIDEANKYEEFYIKEHGTLSPNGYNLREGGLNHTLSDEIKRKIGDKNRGRIKTPEQIEANRQKLLGRKSSDEARLKISIALKGVPKSEEHKEKTRQSHIGMKASEEAKKNMSLVHLGKPLAKEIVEKLSKIRDEKLFNKEFPHYLANISNLPDDTEFSTKELADLLNLTKGTLTKRVIRGNFPNSYHTFVKGGKKYLIPIKDVHDFYTKNNLSVLN
jgi:group I intron endonuclease